MRKQFTFYESFYSAVKRIRKDADRAKAYDAICAYALTGEMPDLDALPDAVAIAFDLIRPTLDSSARKSESGKAGGKQTASKQEANGKQTAREKEGEKEKEKEVEVEVEKENESSKAPARFRPPSMEEVSEYCKSRGNTVDPEAFIAFYASKGWKVGNQPMKDWKQAVITWEKRDGGKKAPPSAKGPTEEDRKRQEEADAVAVEQIRRLREKMRKQAEDRELSHGV